MNYMIRIIWLAAAFFICTYLFTACSLITARAPGRASENLKHADLAAAQIEARKLLLNINKLNDDLSSFKGIGKIRLWNNENLPITERVAWVGAEPSKLSIVVLASGHPALKLSTDGKYLYYLDLRNSDRPFKKIRTSDANLKNIVAMSVKSSDLVMLLSGKVPVRDYSSATLISDLSINDDILVLTKRWKGVVEKIYLDRDEEKVRKVEVFDPSGRLNYRAEFESMQTIHGFQVPLRLVISNDDGAGFSLDIDRYIANVSVYPSMFVLKPPK